MKAALVHDWLTGLRGGEKVLEVLCELFMGADLYTLLYIPGRLSPAIEKMNIKTSFIQRLPFAKEKYRYYLPLMPMAVERFNMSRYDLIISCSSCVAKGVKKAKNSLHICYCHTPMRYVWEMYDEYFGKERIGFFKEKVIRLLAQYLRRWDIESSKDVDIFIANSENVRKRIFRHYGKDAEVIYPPVDTDFFTPQENSGRLTGSMPEGESDFYLVVSAFAPYKRVDLAIEAFNRLRYPLKIIGGGQEEKRLKKMAKSNIEFLGWKNNEELGDCYRRCKALIFPGEEDFGITPLEAQACGKPVIAFGKGGALESIKEGVSGIFFNEQTADCLIGKIKRFETMEFDSAAIRENATLFSRQIFKEKINNFIKEIYRENKTPGLGNRRRETSK